MDAATLLDGWIANRARPGGAGWLATTVAGLGGEEARFHLALGLAGRRLGKADLDLGPHHRQAATSEVPGWDPRDWSCDQAGRVRLVLAWLAVGGNPEVVREAFRCADVGETVALARGLPVYDPAGAFTAEARACARSNQVAAFRAIAHHNPYPANHFDQAAWNQLVLKALFVGVALNPVVALEERADRELATMLADYARERIAARRPVSAELWRVVALHAGPEEIALMQAVRAEAPAGGLVHDALGLALARAGAPTARPPTRTWTDIAAEDHP